MFKTLLVAVDGSERAPHVFSAAAEIANRFDATIVPFRAIQIPPDFPPAAHVAGQDELPSYMKREAIREVEHLLSTIQARCEPPMIREGTPWRAILEAADEKDVDLIIIGSHGYHGLDRVLGTTASRVTNLARRSVLVVHQHP